MGARESLNGCWVAGEDVRVVKAAQDSLESTVNADEAAPLGTVLKVL